MIKMCDAEKFRTFGLQPDFSAWEPSLGRPMSLYAQTYKAKK